MSLLVEDQHGELDLSGFTEAKIPEKLGSLLEAWRYKILWGGRGGAKSENIAQIFLLLGMQEQALFLCTREVQRSIRDSVHALLRQWITKLNLGHFYTVTESSIKGANGSEFIFWGLTNIDSLKSLANVRYCWVEEGQSVKKASWDKLIPTMRWEDQSRGITSEIWVSMNPELETDDTYKRFVLNPPETANIINVNWRDNPWFPNVLRREMEEMKVKDYESYLHVYEGQCIKAVQGAIFRNEMAECTAEGRICRVPYNRARKVDTVWDLGYGDLLTIWFVQPYDGFYHFIDYLSGEGQTISEYLIQLQHRQYLYGIDWLPHDGLDTIIHKRLAGLSAGRDMSIEQIMRDAGRQVRMVQKVFVTDRINAARTIFPQCKFDEERCADGLQALRHYAWGPIDEKTGIRGRKPVHNIWSHGADAFTMAALAVKMPKAEVEKKKSKREESDLDYLNLSGRSTAGYAPFA